MKNNHLVTQVKEINNKKSLITLDYDIVFALYKSEIRRFNIEENGQLSDDNYQIILSEILKKRARERCLNLLSKKSMTESEIVNKLKAGYYPQEIIEYSVNLLKKHHLIDDENYAKSYVELYCKGKSQKQIKQKLYQKGINKEIINSTFEDESCNDEETLRYLIRKKNPDFDSMTKEEYQKLITSFVRKGFNYELVKSVLNYDVFDDYY